MAHSTFFKSYRTPLESPCPFLAQVIHQLNLPPFLDHVLSNVFFQASLRSPGPVTPRDVECEGFHLIYTRIAGSYNQHQHSYSTALQTNVDQKVDDAIESFLRTLSQIGPELLSGGLTLSFFERRATRQLFGLVSHEEKVM
jgi:hypothetical protein